MSSAVRHVSLTVARIFERDLTRLDGKVALVMGAAGDGNMAQVIARRFAAEGARVAVADRARSGVEHFAGELGARRSAATSRAGPMSKAS